MSVGDIVGYDPQDTGGYREEKIAKKYHLSLVLESGTNIGIARVRTHRHPTMTEQTPPPPAPPMEPIRAKNWRIPFATKGKHTSFPF